MNFKHVNLEESKCPKCDKTLDAATAVDGSGARPRPGDLSLCIACGEILTFADDMAVVSCDVSKLPADSKMMTELMKSTWRKMKGEGYVQ